MLQTNASSLVQVSVMGEIDNPTMPGLPASPYLVSAEGKPLVVPAFGGLVYNVRVGDRALGWAAELIQPGVSIKHKDTDANTALGIYACIGNRARVMSGAAAGVVGTVIGKSGRFADHVICDFEPAAMEKMAPGDKIQIKASGVGLKLLDFPEIELKGCSPELLEALAPESITEGELAVPVKGIVSNELAGAGAGLSSEKGTVSLQTSAPDLLEGSDLNDLCFGDLIAVMDWDSRFGHGYLRGSIAIGVICQGDSFRSGYGPGMTIILTSRSGAIKPIIAEDANIADLLRLR